MATSTLPEDRRVQLDGIVAKMIQNKESDANIRFVVDDFKKKYSASEAETSQRNTYGAFFPASPSDNPLTAGLKAAGNIPSSAFNLGKGLVSAAMHPIQTAQAVGSTALGGVEKLIPGPQDHEQSFNNLAAALKERYGSFDALQATATNDPFGFGADVLSVLSGGAALAGKSASAASLIGKTAQTVTSPIRAVAAKTSNAITSTARYGTSQATGLNPATISEIIKNPSAFGQAAENTSRTQLAEAVQQSLDSRLAELSDTGKGYEAIRQSEGTVTVPGGSVGKILNKYGIKLDSKNKIITSLESRPLTPGDKSAIQDFIDNYGSHGYLSRNGLLNVREALSNLSKYDSTRSNISTVLARDLRAHYDELGKTQIPGLKELDAQYAPERQLLGALKKDIFDAKGDLKDGAINKIANLTGKGKDQILARMKEIVPDIEQRVRVLKAVEDIEASSGLKVGTYFRAGAAVTAAASGNIPVIIGAIISQPEIAVQLLRAYGYTGAKAAEVLRPLRAILHDVNNFTIPEPIINYAKDVQPGLSTKSVLPDGVPVPKNAIEELTAKDFQNINNKLGNKNRDPAAQLQLDMAYQETVDKLGVEGKFASDKALDRYMADVLQEWNTQGTEGGLLEGSAKGWTGTASSKPSTAANTSISKKPSGKEGGLGRTTSTSGRFDQNKVTGRMQGSSPSIPKELEAAVKPYASLEEFKSAWHEIPLATEGKPATIRRANLSELTAANKSDIMTPERIASRDRGSVDDILSYYKGFDSIPEIPIVVKNGKIIDGFHRFNKAIHEGKKDILIVEIGKGQPITEATLTDFFNKVKGGTPKKK